MKKLTKKHFKAIATKAIEFGYPEELIAVHSNSVTFWKSEDDDIWDEDLSDYQSKLDNMLTRLSEFFVESYTYSVSYTHTTIQAIQPEENRNFCDTESIHHY